MADEKVIIDITKTGGVEVKVDGVKGDACSLLSAGIVRALGGVVSETPTEEMYEVPQNAQVESSY